MKWRFIKIEAGEELRAGELVYITPRRKWWKPWTWFKRPLAWRVTNADPLTMVYKDEDQR